MITRALFYIGIILIFSLQAIGQKDRIISRDSAWQSKGFFTLNVGQTSFTNWAAGGENQININSILHYRLRYNKGISSWENMIEAKYGTLLFSEMKTKKTNDNLNFASKFGYQANKFWKYSYYLSFNSQFSKGYNYPNDSTVVSEFMAPGYFMAGLGMDYQPTKTISFLLSPMTYKLTLVNNELLANEGNYGVQKALKDSAGNIITPGQRFKNEPGAFIKIYFQQELKSGLSISSRVELFSAFNNHPEKIDVVWASLITYKISKVFLATFSLDLIYNDDVIIKKDTNGDGIKEELGPRLQAKQAFGIGVALSL